MFDNQTHYKILNFIPRLYSKLVFGSLKEFVLSLCSSTGVVPQVESVNWPELQPKFLWGGKMPKWGTSFRRFSYFGTALSIETDSTNRLSEYDSLSLFLTSHEDEWESKFLLCALLNKFQWWQCYQELRGSCILQGGTEQEDMLSWFHQSQFMQKTQVMKEWLWGLTSTRAF